MRTSLSQALACFPFSTACWGVPEATTSAARSRIRRGVLVRISLHSLAMMLIADRQQANEPSDVLKRDTSTVSPQWAANDADGE